MKKIFTYLTFLVLPFCLYAQETIDFEAVGYDWVWNPFANNGDPAYSCSTVENPHKEGLNTSNTVLRYIIREGADPWVGTWCSDFTGITFSESNKIVSMLVYKEATGAPTIIKFEGGEDGAQNIEINDTVTKNNEWQLLQYDFSEKIDSTYNNIVFIVDRLPDGSVRDDSSFVYIDDISFSDEFYISGVSENNSPEFTLYPSQVEDFVTIFSDNLSQAIIYGIDGKKYKNVVLENKEISRIPLHNLHSGIYLIQVTDSNGNSSIKKLIKK